MNNSVLYTSGCPPIIAVMPVSVRHSLPPSALLIPASWGVCPTTIRTAPVASSTF